MKLYTYFNKLLFCKIILFLSNFLILYILSAYYIDSITGQFYYQLSLISVIAMFCNAGIDNSTFYFLKRKIFSVSNILDISYKIIALFTGTAFIVSIFLYFFSANNYTIVFSILFICSLLLQYIINAYFLHVEKGWLSQIGLIIINIIFIGFLILNKASYTIQSAGMLTNIYFSLFFTVSLLTLIYISRYRGKKKPAIASTYNLKLFFKFGAYPYITNALFFLGTNVDLLVVKLYFNADLSIYVQASKIFQLFCSLSYLLYYPFMGKIIDANHKEGVRYLMQISRIISMILLLLIIPFYLGCYFVLDKIFPINYSNIMMLMGYFCISFFPTSLGYFYTSYFVAAKMKKQNLISACIFLCVIILFSFLLVPFLGLKGGAIAFGIAALASLSFDIISFKRVNNLTLADILIIKKEDILFIRQNFKF